MNGRQDVHTHEVIRGTSALTPMMIMQLAGAAAADSKRVPLTSSHHVRVEVSIDEFGRTSIVAGTGVDCHSDGAFDRRGSATRIFTSRSCCDSFLDLFMKVLRLADPGVEFASAN